MAAIAGDAESIAPFAALVGPSETTASPADAVGRIARRLGARGRDAEDEHEGQHRTQSEAHHGRSPERPRPLKPTTRQAAVLSPLQILVPAPPDGGERSRKARYRSCVASVSIGAVVIEPSNS